MLDRYPRDIGQQQEFSTKYMFTHKRKPTNNQERVKLWKDVGLNILKYTSITHFNGDKKKTRIIPKVES